MSSIVVATAREPLRRLVAVPLARDGFPVAGIADWDGLCRAACAPTTRLLLVDPELLGSRAPLLAALVGSLAHPPTVRVVGDARPPLARVGATERAVLQLARRHAGRDALSLAERRFLALQGLGPDPVARLVQLAASTLPVLVSGERGTGKERVARVLHRLSGLPGPFLGLQPAERWTPEGAPGTLYLESAQRRDDLRAVMDAARAEGWRVVGGTRLSEDIPGIKWERLPIRPLRERPDDIRGLGAWWIDEHGRRMGLPRRTFDRGLWALLQAHRWPGNQRELEMFVVEALGRVDQPVIRGAALPDELRALLLPTSEVDRDAEGFEEVARARLLPVVRAYAPGGEVTLHALVVGSAERALIQLVLARTQGNRKAAAALLGLARNTLQSRIEALGLGTIKGRGDR